MKWFPYSIIFQVHIRTSIQITGHVPSVFYIVEVRVLWLIPPGLVLHFFSEAAAIYFTMVVCLLVGVADMVFSIR
jgi:hypothetical protein